MHKMFQSSPEEERYAHNPSLNFLPRNQISEKGIKKIMAHGEGHFPGGGGTPILGHTGDVRAV